MADWPATPFRAPLLDVPVDVTFMVDQRFGPVRDVRLFRLAAPEPAWWVQMCRLARSPVGAWTGDHRAGAAGTSLVVEEAAARANGELLERYSALNAVVDGVVVRPGPFLDRFPRCADDEPCREEFRRLDPEVPLTHVQMERLSDSGSELVPAAYVHLGFWPRPPEPVVTMPISTGLAFHTTSSAAIWAGICEIAERDAMMMSWWLRRGGREIDLSSAAPDELVERLDRLADVGLRARLFDITTDFAVPTVYCVLTGPRFPHLTVGAACRDDPATACAKAMDEAVSIRVAVRNDRATTIPSRTDFGWVERLEHHSLLYAQPGMESALDFMGSGDPAISYAAWEVGDFWTAPKTLEELRDFAATMSGHGWTILWTDVSAPEVSHLGHTVKVVIPEMVPLSQTHQARWLATPRLVAAAGGSDGSAHFNPLPHPFA